MTQPFHGAAALALAALAATASAQVVQPIPYSSDGSYTATGPATTMTPEERRTARVPREPAPRTATNPFSSAEGSSRALGGPPEAIERTPRPARERQQVPDTPPGQGD